MISAAREKECMAHPRGQYYFGSKNVSKSGKLCLEWTSSAKHVHLVASLPDERTADARNYCRFVPGQDWVRPSCIVEISAEYRLIEECDVRYCGGTIYTLILLNYCSSPCRSRKCMNYTLIFYTDRFQGNNS